MKLFIAACLLPLVKAALTNEQLSSVFGSGATGLTGASVALPRFEFSIVTNDSACAADLVPFTS